MNLNNQKRISKIEIIVDSGSTDKTMKLHENMIKVIEIKPEDFSLLFKKPV